MTYYPIERRKKLSQKLEKRAEFEVLFAGEKEIGIENGTIFLMKFEVRKKNLYSNKYGVCTGGKLESTSVIHRHG